MLLPPCPVLQSYVLLVVCTASVFWLDAVEMLVKNLINHIRVFQFQTFFSLLLDICAAVEQQFLTLLFLFNGFCEPALSLVVCCNAKLAQASESRALNICRWYS